MNSQAPQPVPDGGSAALVPSATDRARQAWDRVAAHLPSASFLWYAVSAGSTLGALFTLAVAFALATVTFLGINSLFHAKCYSHLTSFPPIDTVTELTLLREALNKRAQQDGASLTALRNALHVRVISGSLSDPETAEPTLQTLKRLVESAGPVELPGLHPSHADGADVTFFWWSTAALPEPATTDATAPAAVSDSAAEFPEFGYALELRPRVSAGALTVQALYYPVIAGKPEAGSQFTVLHRHRFPVFAFEPCSVRHSEKELAGRFAEEMKRSMRGRGEYQGMLLKSRDEREKVEIYLAHALLRLLGRPSSAEPTDEPIPSTDYRALESIVSWPRRINGSDAFGVIQYLTVVAFWALALIWVAKMRIVASQSVHLQNPDLFPGFGEIIERDVVTRQLGRIEQERQTHDQLTRGLVPCAPLEILYAGYAATQNARPGTYDNVPSFVTSQASVAANAFTSAHWLMRYLIWLIPSVGFVGTVIGIGVALLGTGAVLSDDKFEQQAAIQSIAANLGTAFDTTFVALILAIIGMFLLHLVQRVEEHLIQESTERAIGSLIDPDAVESSSQQEWDPSLRAGLGERAGVEPPGSTSRGRGRTGLKTCRRARVDARHIVRARRAADVLVVIAAALIITVGVLWIRPPDKQSPLHRRILQLPAWVQRILPSHSESE